jgi:hypothetical protein
VTLLLDIGFFTEALTKLANLPGESDNWDRHVVRDNLQLDADQNGGWSKKGVSPWRLLLHYPFDKVTIPISDDSQNDSTDTDAQAEKSRNVVSILRESLGDMANNIGSDWLSFQHALDWKILGQEEYPLDTSMVSTMTHRSASGISLRSSSGSLECSTSVLAIGTVGERSRMLA